MKHKTTLQQWAALDAVVRCGGFAQAAVALFSSQSAISYLVSRLQSSLGVRLLEMNGRRALLTEHGRSLLDEANLLVKGLDALEQRAELLEKDQETTLTLAASSAFPEDVLFAALARFRQQHRFVRINLQRVTRLTAETAFEQLQSHLCILSHSPEQHHSDHLMDVRLIAVTHRDHPLQTLTQPVSPAQLAHHLAIQIVEESAVLEKMDLNVSDGECWNVNTVSAALAAVRSGCCYGWLPEDVLASHLASGELRRLNLQSGSERKLPLFLLRNERIRLGATSEELIRIFFEESSKRDRYTTRSALLS